MGKWPRRRRRGSSPDHGVPLHEREPDSELLRGSYYGNHLPGDVPMPTGGPYTFEEVHPSLREILVKMDKEEIKNVASGLHILVRLEPRDFVRLRSLLKLINVIYGIWWVIKWSLGMFFAGLTAVTLAGDQLQKIWGWVQNLWKLVRP